MLCTSSGTPQAADVYRHHYAPYLRTAVPDTARAKNTDVSLRAQVNRAAEELAAAVSDQWRHEEKLRRIQDPVPLPVRWTAADPLLSDHVETFAASPATRSRLTAPYMRQWTS